MRYIKQELLNKEKGGRRSVAVDTPVGAVYIEPLEGSLNLWEWTTPFEKGKEDSYLRCAQAIEKSFKKIFDALMKDEGRLVKVGGQWECREATPAF